MEKEKTKENYIELLKCCLKEKNIEKTAECLLEVYNDSKKNFKKSIMLGGILPEPLSFDIDKNIYKFNIFKEAYKLVIGQFKKNEDKSKNDFTKQLAIIIKGYEVLISHSISNERRCDKCEYIHYNKAKQLQMWCIFIEDQMRLAGANINQTIAKNGVYTGTESMTPLDIEGNKEYQLSSSDAIESNMELAEEVFRFIFYINKKNIKEYVDVSCVDAYPYELQPFEEMIHLTNHRVMLRKTWDLFKYREWTLKIYRASTEKIYCFKPQNEEKVIKESAAIHRTGYNALQKSLGTAFILQKFNDKHRFVMREISKIGLDYVFNIDKKDLKTFMGFYENIIRSQMVFTLKFYGEDLWKVNVKDDINLQMIFDTINYLYSIANIYMEKAHKNIDYTNRNDYYKLAPIVDKLKLGEQLSKILGVSEKIAIRCIDIFTFKPIFEKKQIVLDIFSQPLVYLSDEQIIFTPCFIMQMNVERIIDKILGAIDYNLFDKGYKMEKIVNNLIDKSKYIHVNKNKVKFTAFDEKDVEFDCIAKFEGKLIIMEMKCRTAPYSDKERNDKEVVLIEAIEQVKRRVQVVQNNWEEIKKRSSINLMENPPKENDIIKIVCFNFFDFTGQVIDGVYITDYSAITKYFNKPIDYANIDRESSIEKIPVRNIWGGKKPTLNNLLNFLEMPSMMKDFYDNIKSIYKPIIRIEEENENLSVMDFYLEKNPFEEYSKLFIKENEKFDEAAVKEHDDIKSRKESKTILKKKNKHVKASRKLNRKK